jgi:hypothetical protein
LSTTEAEFMAITEAVKDGLWLTQVFNGLGIAIGTFTVFNDNQGALKLVKHPYYHHKTKHIDVRLFFVRQHVENKDLELKYMETKQQIADMLTKPLPAVTFQKLRDLSVNIAY